MLGRAKRNRESSLKSSLLAWLGVSSGFWSVWGTGPPLAPHQNAFSQPLSIPQAYQLPRAPFSRNADSVGQGGTENLHVYHVSTGIFWWLRWYGKESAHNPRDLGSIPGLGRSPGGGHGNPLQYSYLEKPMNGGAWWAMVHSVAKKWRQLK